MKYQTLILSEDALRSIKDDLASLHPEDIAEVKRALEAIKNETNAL